MATEDWLELGRTFTWEELVPGRMYVNAENDPAAERTCAIGIVLAIYEPKEEEVRLMYLSSSVWHDNIPDDPFDDEDQDYRPELLHDEYFDSDEFYQVKERLNWGVVENIVTEWVIGKSREDLHYA